MGWYTIKPHVVAPMSVLLSNTSLYRIRATREVHYELNMRCPLRVGSPAAKLPAYVAPSLALLNPGESSITRFMWVVAKRYTEFETKALIRLLADKRTPRIPVT